MANSKKVNEEIKEYWNGASSIYDEYIEREGHTNIHYGYLETDESVEDTEQATVEMNQRLAKTANIQPDDTVLFCGCGYGGPAIWAAKEIGIDAIGINIVEDQLEQARKSARQAGVADQTDFRLDDHTKMDTIDDNEIDVVWAIESIMYAQDKRDFLDQARRVLGDDGRFVVAEGFKLKREMTEDERVIVDKLLDGWSVPNFAHIDDFTDYMNEIGFRAVESSDITENVEPFAQWMVIGRPYIYLCQFLKLVGRMNAQEVIHIKNMRHQHRVIKNDLMGYYIVSGSV